VPLSLGGLHGLAPPQFQGVAGADVHAEDARGAHARERESERASERERERASQAHTIVAGEGGAVFRLAEVGRFLALLRRRHAEDARLQGCFETRQGCFETLRCEHCQVRGSIADPPLPTSPFVPGESLKES